MKHANSGCAVLYFVAALFSVFAPTAVAENSIFSIQPSPSPNIQGNVLNAVTAVSATDAWAVGFQNDNNLNESRTLILHWDGSKWKAVPSPNPGSPKSCDQFNTGNVLNAVSAISSTDVWAVGFFFNCTVNELTPMALHWDGASWKNIPTPPLRTNANSAFNGVTALATDDVYAVGYFPAANGAVRPLIEHWDGAAWKLVPGPTDRTTSNSLFSISALSATDIWAVGVRVAQGTSIKTLVLHYDGAKWSIVPSPNPLPTGDLNQNVLLSVQAVSSKDVTAVGYLLNTNALNKTTLVEHWDGTKWKVVPSPNESTAQGALNTLQAVTAVSATDLYAVGFFGDAATNGQETSLIEHFDGKQWSIIDSPTKGLAQQLLGVYALPGTTDTWSVGGFAPNGDDPETGLLQLPKSLVLFSSGS